MSAIRTTCHGAFLERHGLPEGRVVTVWESVALHTTPEVRSAEAAS